MGKAPGVVTSGQSAPTDAQYLERFNRAKRECFADRWRFERLWTRNIHYINLRQWLGVYDRSNGWMDARIARGVPRPVTSKPKEGLQAIRSMFTAANLGVDVRPLKNNAKSVLTATTADKLAPVLYTANDMDAVLHEGDFWFIVCGNVIYHVSYDDNGKYVAVPYEKCLTCGLEVTGDAIAQNGQKCPACGGTTFTRAMDANGQPRVDHVPQGDVLTTPLSPLEVAFPMQRARWKDVDRLIRLRWRTKRYYEENSELKDYVSRIQFTKTPGERSLQIFQSLPFQTELNPSGSGAGGWTGEEEGVAEYELWEKPTQEHPDGLVLRVVGDSNPIVLHSESEGLPGPLPYHDAKGDPLWTFHHAGYEHVGGRVIASGALDPVIQKFDQLNRLDSIYEMMMTRMAIPQILKPKGQEISWQGESPAMPGLILEYPPAPGGGKPEVWEGQEPPRAWVNLRQQIALEIDAGLGTNDILKGVKPPNVEAFSTMQLLIEAGEARFAGAFQSRANCFRDVSRSQMEIEREFGQSERVQAVATAGRGYSFETFRTADLDGEVTYDVADGSTKPKTTLAERASIEHLKALGGVDMNDPDTRYAISQKLGQTDLIPTIDKQHVCALQNQESFIQWVTQPGAQAYVPLPPAPPGPDGVMPAPVVPPDPSTDQNYPFTLLPWYDAKVHRVELVKWAVSEDTIQLFRMVPSAKYFVGKYLGELESKLMQMMREPPEPIKTIVSLKGPDLTADPQVRQAWDYAQRLPPPAAAAPGPAAPNTAPQGAALALPNSAQNSAPIGSTPQPAVGV